VYGPDELGWRDLSHSRRWPLDRRSVRELRSRERWLERSQVATETLGRYPNPPFLPWRRPFVSAHGRTGRNLFDLRPGYARLVDVPLFPSALRYTKPVRTEPSESPVGERMDGRPISSPTRLSRAAPFSRYQLRAGLVGSLRTVTSRSRRTRGVVDDPHPTSTPRPRHSGTPIVNRDFRLIIAASYCWRTKTACKIAEERKRARHPSRERRFDSRQSEPRRRHHRRGSRATPNGTGMQSLKKRTLFRNSGPAGIAIRDLDVKAQRGESVRFADRFTKGQTDQRTTGGRPTPGREAQTQRGARRDGEMGRRTPR
jgi:hypothetical protein